MNSLCNHICYMMKLSSTCPSIILICDILKCESSEHFWKDISCHSTGSQWAVCKHAWRRYVSEDSASRSRNDRTQCTGSRPSPGPPPYCWCPLCSRTSLKMKQKLELAFNNVEPKDRYFVLDLVQFRTELGYVRITNQKFWLDGSRASFLVPSYSPSKS